MKTKIENALSTTYTWELISQTAREELVDAVYKLMTEVEQPIEYDVNPDDVAVLGLR